jgi:hypothetical protein
VFGTQAGILTEQLQRPLQLGRKLVPAAGGKQAAPDIARP